jgi:rhodanese-related sulfurtransferase
MSRQTFKTMVASLAGQVEEIFPWDLDEELQHSETPLLLDIRCPHEFDAAHIEGSLNVPRGILESAVDFGYDETVPELVQARHRRVVVICRSGNRSILAAHTLQLMGYGNVASLRSGIRGWNDYEQALIDRAGNRLHPDVVEGVLASRLSPEQISPQRGVPG